MVLSTHLFLYQTLFGSPPVIQYHLENGFNLLKTSIDILIAWSIYRHQAGLYFILRTVLIVNIFTVICSSLLYFFI